MNPFRNSVHFANSLLLVLLHVSPADFFDHLVYSYNGKTMRANFIGIPDFRVKIKQCIYYIYLHKFMNSFYK